jgi:peptidyl-prolyl cis-trans isomerase D
MFKKVLRFKGRRTVALWVVILLALPFILFFHWGAGQSGPGPGGTAGVIFGRPIPWERYDQISRAIRRELESQLGDDADADAVEAVLRQQTWDRLILQEEARRRVTVTDEELARAIQSQPAFQQAGRFDSALYFRFVRAMGLSPRLFEEQVRDDLRIQKLLEQVKADDRESWMAALRRRARLKSYVEETPR